MQIGNPLRHGFSTWWLVSFFYCIVLNAWSQAVDVSEGLRIMADRTTGNCVSCHEIPAWRDPSQSSNRLSLQGNFGPSLHGVGARYTKEQLHQWVKDARVIRPHTWMPPYGSIDNLHLPARSQHLLTPAQIEAVVDALATFQQSSPLAPIEATKTPASASGLVQLQSSQAMNPISLWTDEGKRKWEKDCQTCHSTEKVVKSVPNFPKLDSALQLINLEDQISICRQRVEKTSSRTTASLYNDDHTNLELSSFLHDAARLLSINIAPPNNAESASVWKKHLTAGKSLFQTRLGHMNLSCQQCHDGKQGASMRAQRITAGHPTGFPAYRISWQGLGSMERRIRACFSGVQAQVPAQQDIRLRQLELYLKTRAQGMPLEGPSIRQ
jgi:sulfur-oxidizing protein SoxA